MYIFLNVLKLWRNMLPQFYTQKKGAVGSFETFINVHKITWHSTHNTILHLFGFRIAVLQYDEVYRSTEATSKRLSFNNTKAALKEKVEQNIALIMNTTNEMQLYGLIYYFQSALYVSGDVFAHHQEPLTVFTGSGSIHPSCCRMVSWMS